MDRLSQALIPLVVDLDGTLLRTDLLHESTLVLLRSSPHLALLFPLWLFAGRAHFKQQVARRITFEPRDLPFNEPLLDWLRQERSRGRRLVLCTGSDHSLAASVAGHLDLFDEVLASDGVTNLTGHAKAELLTRRFGESGFDYAGNARSDLHVWRRARGAVVVSAPDPVRAAAGKITRIERVFDQPSGSLGSWIKALRPHQWLKNLLLLLPLLGAHRLAEPGLLIRLAAAFASFSLCASAVYVVNDLMDLQSDRQHPRKRLRPFAAGRLPALQGVAAACILLSAAAAIATMVGMSFASWLAVYFASTLLYTFYLKRKLVVDCVALAGLYTMRILAGGAAAGIGASFWILALSLFLFLSLAFVKRYSELKVLLERGVDEAHGRGYVISDLSLIETMGIASGFAAVVVLALYVNGPTITALYHRPELMWLTVPIMLYWINRMWLRAHRGAMHDDPIVFALKDRVSLMAGGAFLFVMWLAT